jgi:4-hydroxy-4-methyl-2-oxoglutarate aldolase
MNSGGSLVELFASPETIQSLTPLNPFDRLADGRPRVPDELLERISRATTEEAWNVLRLRDYHHQFEGGWFQSHPGRVLVGRAVTAIFMPFRPDLDDLVIKASGKPAGDRGGSGGQNSWVIDSLLPGDVMVVDMFGKVEDGPVVGDNLATTISRRTGAGAVIEGRIRDYDGIKQISPLQIFCRGVHPSFIRECTLVGVNIPVRIGGATVLPGDVVLGSETGVIFIPPHLAEEVVTRSEDVRLRDIFSKQRLAEGRYSAFVIDRDWTEEIEEDFRRWRAGRTQSA